MKQPNSPKRSADRERLELLIAYTASLNPNGVRRLIYTYGYPIRHQNDLKQFLVTFLRQEREKGMDELLAIHPDRDLMLEAAPVTTPDALSAYAGPADSSAPGQLVADLILTRKTELVDLVNRHGSALLYVAPDVQVGHRAIDLLATNPVFAREFAELAGLNASGFGLDAVAGMVSTVGGVANNLIASKAQAKQAKTDVTMMLLARQSERLQLENSRRSSTMGWAVGGILVMVLILAGVLIYINRSN